MIKALTDRGAQLAITIISILNKDQRLSPTSYIERDVDMHQCTMRAQQ